MSDTTPQGDHEIFDRYPGARAFADLIQGDTEADVEEMARLIDSRVREINAAKEPAATDDGLNGVHSLREPGQTPATPVAPAPAPAPRPVPAGKRTFGDFITERWESGDALA